MYSELDTPPRHLGRYEVTGVLGHGGMAVVYRARDPRLDRDVAIKVLHPHLSRDEESKARFEREARAAARLRHPAIVEVYELSETGAPDSYLVTEILEGPTLRKHAELHPGMPAEVAAAIGIVLCEALSCAHKQGVIHRDVKPDNIMIHRGALKLTDFGIAHVADQQHVTVTGQVLGSPAHMAPEQIDGAAVDARTDLFAAGTVLYWLAVGRLPFEGTNAHALLRKILEGEYPDPLRAAPTIGHRFAAMLRKALARDPAGRFQDAEALRAELLAFVQEAGWEGYEKELSRYFRDPEGFCREHRAQLLERLPALGVQARRQRQFAEATGYFNRVLALDPANVKVLALARGTARRRAMLQGLRTGAIIAGVAGLTVAVLLLAAGPRRHPPALRPDRSPVVARGNPPGTARPDVVVAPPPVAEVRPAPATDAGLPPVATTSRTALHLPEPRPRLGVPAVPPPPRPAVPTREVWLVPSNRHVWYAVDGGPPTTWTSSSQNLGLLPVGPHRIEVHPIPEENQGLLCDTWIQEVPVVASGDPRPQRVLPQIRCRDRRANESSLDERDGGPGPL